MAHESYETFEAVKVRLEEIIDAVGDESLPLDDALALYEEAVGLGLRASDLLETNIDLQQLEGEQQNEPVSQQDDQQDESTKPQEAHESEELSGVVVDAAAEQTPEYSELSATATA